MTRARSSTPVVLHVALLAPVTAAGVGLLRLTSSPTATRLVLPVVLAVAVGAAVSAAARRMVGVGLGLVIGAVGVSLASIWSVLPAATTWGLPTGRTADVVAQVMTAAWRLTRHTPTPVPASQGVALWITAGAGVTAAVSMAALEWGRAGRRRRLSVAGPLLPSAGLFCYAALLSSDADRAAATAAYLAGALVFVVMADSDWSKRAGSDRVRSGPRRWLPGAFVGLLTVSVGAVVPLALGPGLSGLRLSLFAATRAPALGTAVGQVPSQADDVGTSFLVDNLGAVLRNESDADLFIARSPMPTYWQVASLTTFDGTTWVADRGITGEAEGLPAIGDTEPVLSQPPPTATFNASIQIVNLQTTLLPVPPGTISALGDGAVDQPAVGVFLPGGSSYGAEYGVVAAVPPTAQASEASVPRQPQLAPYLELPPLPSDVTALAEKITGRTANPLEKALALTAFFQGNGFRFSLSADYTGPHPLETFLFDTRTGFCQQFAGAFAVLARAVGLPTRLEVGFTTGTPGAAPDSYVVTGADAHVWPQVYLGPRLGWVSFEPTPSSGTSTRPSGVLAAGAPQGTSSSSTPAPDSARAAGANRHLHGASSAKPSIVGSSRPQRSLRASAPSQRHSAASRLWWVLLACALAVVGVVTPRPRMARLVTVVRLRTLPNRAAVAAHWRQADAALARRRLARRPSETPLEHAERVAPRLHEAGGAYRQLAAMACLAEYSGRPVGSNEVTCARALERRVVRQVRERPPAPVA